jgi:hypothetical protein
MLKLVVEVVKRKYDPFIVFSFSKRECEAHANAIQALDMTEGEACDGNSVPKQKFSGQGFPRSLTNSYVPCICFPTHTKTRVKPSDHPPTRSTCPSR